MRMARTMGRVVNGYNLRYRTTRQSWTADFAPGAPLVSHSEHMPCCRRLRLAILCNIANMTSSAKPEVHIDASTQIRRKSVPRWRRGVVVSGVRRMNEVNPHRARLVLRAGIPSRKAVTRGVFWVFARGVEPTVSRFVVKTVFMPSTSLEMHQNRFRPGLLPGPHWGSLQRSLRPLAGGEGARRVLPKNPTLSSALRASAIQAMLCRPPIPPENKS